LDSIKLVKFSEEFLDLSYKWLRDNEIRILTNTPCFTREKQKEWYNSLKNRKDYFIWGVKYNSRKIGACGLKNITDEKAEYWGYIGEKDCWGKGIGTVMLNKVIEFARKRNIKTLWLRVRHDNVRAKRLYANYGFKEVSEKDNILVMEKNI